MTHHRQLKRPQLSTRLQPQLTDEIGLRLAIHKQGVGLLPRAIQRQHQLRPATLAQRLLSDQPPELGHKLPMPAKPEISVHTILDRHRPPSQQPPDLVPQRRLVREIRQRFAAPQLQCLLQQRRGSLRIAPCKRGAPLLCQRFEAHRVHALRLDDQRITTRARLQHIGAQLRPHSRHEIVERMRRRTRRRLPPDRLDQRVAPHRLIPTQQQHPDQQP